MVSAYLHDDDHTRTGEYSLMVETPTGFLVGAVEVDREHVELALRELAPLGLTVHYNPPGCLDKVFLCPCERPRCVERRMTGVQP